MADYDVIVIGAGTGGLSVGAQLAKQGRKVLLLEQSERIGGCCSTFEQQGFHFDLGASLIEATDLIDEAFQRLGTTLKAEVNLLPCDPIYTVIMKDGTRMKYPTSLAASAEEIQRLAPAEVPNWERFCAAMKELSDNALSLFRSPMDSLADFVRFFANAPGMLKYAPLFFCSYQDVLQHYFKNERVRESIAYQTLFIGLPPALCPGVFAMVAYGEHAGVYYSQGGMIGIPAALQRCGERFGMEVRLKTLVNKVLVRDGRACGVRLADGTEITASVVVSDINAKTLYLDLIGEEHLPWLTRIGIKSYEYAMAVPMLYLGVDYTPPLESHHTLATLPTAEINRYWWETYEKGRYPTEQQFGIISWTSHSDPALAPEGQHVIVLTLAPAPYRRSDGKSWDEIKPQLTEQIIDYYSTHYIPGLREHVKVALLATPLDFERNLRLPEGAIYALRQDITHETIFRPAAKSKSIAGLYLVGASTHPGGGVPTTIASGMIAADLIERCE